MWIIFLFITALILIIAIIIVPVLSINEDLEFMKMRMTKFKVEELDFRIELYIFKEGGQPDLARISEIIDPENRYSESYEAVMLKDEWGNTISFDNYKNFYFTYSFGPPDEQNRYKDPIIFINGHFAGEGISIDGCDDVCQNDLRLIVLEKSKSF